MISHPAALPSRTTLQSINDYLLTEQRNRLPRGLDSGHIKGHADQGASCTAMDTFRALEGRWILERNIVNFRNDGLAGTVSGAATFFPRSPTSEDALLEYLYREEGIFHAGQGIQMTINRGWIWRLAKPRRANEQPSISIHFVKADGETEDYLYNRIQVLPEVPVNGQEGKDDGVRILTAAAEHPCCKDFYVSSYRYCVRNGRLEQWDVEHQVKGPAKDYISRTNHTRSD
jgi:hypothetical protein